MRIVCPNCQTAYEIAADALGEAGRSVRCARCQAAWFVAAPAPEMAVSLEWDSAPAAPAAYAEPAGRADGLDGATDAATIDNVPDRPGAAAVLAAAPQPVAAIESQSGADSEFAVAAHEDIETVAARRAPPVKARGQFRRWRPSVPLVILALTALLAALIAWRTPVVRFAPQTAALFAGFGLPVNLRGLAFEAVKASGETDQSVPVMVIDGLIANVTKGPVDVPRLRFALRNQAGIEVYAWTALPSRPYLAEGETLPFRTRLASPPADARDVQVRFFNRRDLEAGS